MTDQEPTSDNKKSSLDLKHLIREVSQEVDKRKTPILIAFLATFLALVSMADDDAEKQALVAHIESSNQFAYFQAKNIRKTDSEIAASMFESLGKTELAKKWQDKADRYGSEKGAILKSAKAEQAKREISMKQSDYFGVAIALLQIAIVLASVSLLAGGGLLLSCSLILSIISIFFVVNGYGLYYEVPTDPKAIFEQLSTMQ